MSYQSPKTQSPQKQETAKKLDEKPTQPEPYCQFLSKLFTVFRSLSELEAKKKEAMERLTLKQREFDFISKLGKEDLNVFIQGKNVKYSIRALYSDVYRLKSNIHLKNSEDFWKNR